ncbi:MAG: hypothetical protein IJQ52_04630, partial [Bacteroidales bacterium]|nr:hypothetical protein [Bacteroidales bacterium]
YSGVKIFRSIKKMMFHLAPKVKAMEVLMSHIHQRMALVLALAPLRFIMKILRELQLLNFLLGKKDRVTELLEVHLAQVESQLMTHRLWC